MLIIRYCAKLKNILSKIQVRLKPDREYSKNFEDIPIIGFKIGKILKDILFRAKVPSLKIEEDFCGPYNKPRCEISEHVTKTHQFEWTSTKRIYSIRPQNFNYASKNVVYLFTCKTCYKQYGRSTEKFWSRFNNYRYSHINLLRNKKVKQESFHTRFVESRH